MACKGCGLLGSLNATFIDASLCAPVGRPVGTVPVCVNIILRVPSVLCMCILRLV